MKARIAILTSDKIDVKIKIVIRDKGALHNDKQVN